MQTFYKHAPESLQNILISLYNIRAYTYRYTGRYKEHLKELSILPNKTNEERLADLKTFLSFAKTNSKFYNQRIKLNIEDVHGFEAIRKIPILTKDTLRTNINSIITLSKGKGILSKTGGTTGVSLNVIFTNEDNQRRFANVNAFRMKHGYRIGQKTAWFSGKTLLSKNHVNRFWRTDYLFNIRYYSTFHINDETAPHYLKDILEFKPKYFVGFPSCLYELALYGLNTNFERPTFIKAIFPNAETITTNMRNVIEAYFGAKIYDQYGSAEGAPHIFQYNNEYRFDPREGFLEVLDEYDQPAKTGRMVVTSYHTKGTPLIRYDIGDFVELKEKYDYNKIPVIKRIIGREMNFINSPETGKINAGNISNTTKNVNGIIAFQIIQISLNEVKIKLLKSNEYTLNDEKLFLSNMRERIGNNMNIVIDYVEELPREKSGKFNIIKNNLV